MSPRFLKPRRILVVAGRSHWLARNVVQRAREKFELPVAHVVVPRARAPALAA
jgi:hypothetical protein